MLKVLSINIKNSDSQVSLKSSEKFGPIEHQGVDLQVLGLELELSFIPYFSYHKTIEA